MVWVVWAVSTNCVSWKLIDDDDDEEEADCPVFLPNKLIGLVLVVLV